MIFSSEDKTVQGCSPMYPPIDIGGWTLDHTGTRGGNWTNFGPILNHCTNSFKYLINSLLSEMEPITPRGQKENRKAPKKNRFFRLVQLHQKINRHTANH